MPPRRNRDINDIYEQELEQRIIARMNERFDQFVDQFVDRMNDMMNPRKHEDCNSQRSKGEESENPFFKGDGSSLFVEHEEWEYDEKNRCQFMIPVLKMSLRMNKDLLGKEDFVRKKTTWKTLNINDVYERIMARIDERLDQFVDQFANRMNDMMNLRRYYGVAGDDYKGAPIFDDDYEEALVFDDDQFKEESMPVYDTDIKDVTEEEE
ncbi:hypothetical protein Tco_0567829 [Tanacetum coccineum]